MCGIIGGTRVHRDRLQRALRTIRHRGPDARDVWRSQGGEVGLGHARLAIIDLHSAANQPMVCSRTGNVLTFNGEIYNFRPLRQELERLGWTFRTRSDTEVLLASYGQWGERCLSRLNGMFAFALYDPVRRQIFLARDRVGKKPLYYSLFGSQLSFASELKALLALRPEIPRQLDEEALNEFLGIGYIPGELSIVSDIRKIAPAHYAVYDLRSGSFHTHRYWRLPSPCLETIKERDAAEELEKLLIDAVRLRLQSDVPVGVFLSGGLDSSLIAAIAARESPGIAAYTISFPVPKYDESSMAGRVAHWTGMRHLILPVDLGEWELLDWLGRQLDEPFADSSLLPTFVLSRAVRQHVKVALSGDGGDELFGGYDYYAQTLNETGLERFPRVARSLLSRVQSLMPLGMKGKNWLRRLPYDDMARFMAMSFAPEEQKIPLLQPAIERRMASFGPDRHRLGLLNRMRAEPGGESLSLLQQMTRVDFHSYLPDDILVKVDRASMLASLEVRSPLLDHRIVELAFRLPDRLRMNGGIRKYLLKRIARKYLPADFPLERKQGFSIPEAEWLRGPWYEHVVREVRAGALLDTGNVRRIANAHRKSGRCSRSLFKAVMLSKWRQASRREG